MKKFFLFLSLVLSPSVWAMTPIYVPDARQALSYVERELPWQIGEECNYNLNMGFISGTMQMLVRERVDRGFWLEQNLAIMGQTQKVEILFDAETGEILEMLVNGKPETPPSSTPPEVLEAREESVTVPAGTFNSIFAKLKDTQSGDVSQVWINQEEIPVSGMLKTIAPSQMGEVTLELTSFIKK